MEPHYLLEPRTERPKFQSQSDYSGSNVIRDQFTISTWLALGAGLQTVLTLLLPFRYAVLPALLFLTLHTASTLLVSLGLRSNPLRQHVVPTKFAARLPFASLSLTANNNKPASPPSLVVFLLGFQINHPLGLLAPGGRTINQHFAALMDDIHTRADEYGLVGHMPLQGGVRGAKNDLVQLMYFRDVEGLHRFAHDPLHKAAWRWWNEAVGASQGKDGKKGRNTIPHLGIWHEAYVVQPGGWETIYAQTTPTGLGAGWVKRQGGAGGEGEKAEREEWLSVMVDARRGAMRTSSGRMARSEGLEHEGMPEVDYQDVV
ncbi:MAG: hypothetical protein M1821_008081 [Bathelium mastoideum]|nr:MAG: hypothetical protein M1821_008081 [Bathelium mastoideum]